MELLSPSTELSEQAQDLPGAGGDSPSAEEADERNSRRKKVGK